MTIRGDISLMQACAKCILGETTGMKIKGSPEKVKALQDVVLASKNLYEALSTRETMSEISPLLDAKRKAAEAFKRVVGITWQM